MPTLVQITLATPGDTFTIYGVVWSLVANLTSVVVLRSSANPSQLWYLPKENLS